MIVGLAIGYFLLIGGTELGTLAPIQAVNGVLGAAVCALWILRLPTHADSIDRFVVLALLLYLLACVLGAFPRASFAAATDATTYAALFSVTRWEVQRAGLHRTVIVAMAIVGAILGLLIVAVWGTVWLDWYATLGSFPPLDLRLPAGPYRHAHVIAMLLVVLSPALIQLLRGRGWHRLVGGMGLATGSVVVLMAGARGVWLAVGLVVLLAAGERWLARRGAASDPPTVDGRSLALAAVALLVVGVLAVALLEPLRDRLAAFGTLSLRAEYWRETLDAWLARPLQGWGPGSFPIVISLGDYFDLHTYVPRHADSAPIQLLGEAGLLGVVAWTCLSVPALRAWRHRGSIAGPIAALLLFGLMSFTDNPSDTPMLVVAGCLWAALALPWTPAQGELRRPSRAMTVATRSAAIVCAAAVASTIAAAAVFQSVEEAPPQDRPGLLELASGLDPGMALYARSAGTQALLEGSASTAREWLLRASRLNPADATAFRALALADAELGRDDEAERAVDHAVERGRSHPANLLTAALLAHRREDPAAARSATVDALAYAPWLLADDEVARAAGGDDASALLDESVGRTETLATRDVAWRLPLAWSYGLLDVAPGATLREDEAVLAAVLSCRLEDATAASSRRFAGASDIGAISVLLRARLDGDEDAWREAIDAARLRTSAAARAIDDPRPGDPLRDDAEDQRLYGMAGPALTGSRSFRIPSPDESLAAWLQDPRGVASRRLPAAPLASCGP